MSNTFITDDVQTIVSRFLEDENFITDAYENKNFAQIKKFNAHFRRRRRASPVVRQVPLRASVADL
jgi:hypothetical protein